MGERARALRVVAPDGRWFGSSEVGIASALIETGQLERFHCHHGGNDGAQGLENMPWKVGL